MTSVPEPTSGHVRITRTGGTITLVIDRPPVNALSSALLLELNSLISQLAVDDQLRCLIITGAGEKCFIAGADVREAAATPPELAPERTALGQKLMLGLESLPVPVIIAVNGACLGGGCELALAGDIRIAAEHARFGQPEVNLGIIPGFGGTQRLPRLIGSGPALDLMLTGRDISAAEALQLGLVSRVVPSAQLEAEATATAERISSFSREAIAAIKLAVHRGRDLPLTDALQQESELSAEVRLTANAIEGLAAFVEKRKPDFNASDRPDPDSSR